MNAGEGRKFEKVKLDKDGSVMWTEVHKPSVLLREGKTAWEDLNVDYIDTYLTWGSARARPPDAGGL